jgi:hypothetical protein
MFRTPVQPAELARKLGREMDRGKKLGVGKIYAPVLYTVLLSRQDDSALGGFADTLAGELETYLLGYAREHNYELATRPVVRFLVDKDLKLGRFDVIGELLSPEELAAELGYHPENEPYETPRPPNSARANASKNSSPAVAPPPVTPPIPDPVPQPAAVPAGGVFDADQLGAEFHASAEPQAEAPSLPAEASPTELITPAASLATVTVRGVDHDVVLRGNRLVIGRLATCDICLSDANTSREHAAFEREDTGWVVRDLGSTNGTLVNGQRVPRQRLRDGDLVVIGVTELVYHEPRD